MLTSGYCVAAAQSTLSSYCYPPETCTRLSQTKKSQYEQRRGLQDPTLVGGAVGKLKSVERGGKGESFSFGDVAASRLLMLHWMAHSQCTNGWYYLVSGSY